MEIMAGINDNDGTEISSSSPVASALLVLKTTKNKAINDKFLKVLINNYDELA